MAAPKGTRPPAAGKGRPKGSQNKVTADVKAMVLEALTHAGGAEYLYMQALDNPKAFMALVGRVLPMQVTGDADAPLVVKLVTVTSEAEQKAAWRKP